MGVASAIRAGRAFVEVFLDNNPLVRGLNVVESRLKGLGARGNSDIDPAYLHAFEKADRGGPLFRRIPYVREGHAVCDRR